MALYWVRFSNNEMLEVCSADAKDMSRAALRMAHRKAKHKALEKFKRRFPGVKPVVTEIRCVG